MKTMAEVLESHYIDITQTSPDNIGRCVCGWSGDGMSVSWDDHLAAALTAAGYGPVKEAQAGALRDAADARDYEGLYALGWETRRGLRARAAAIEAGQ